MPSALQATNGNQCCWGCLGWENALWGRLVALWGLGLGVARRCSACTDLREGVHWIKRGSGTHLQHRNCLQELTFTRLQSRWAQVC